MAQRRRDADHDDDDLVGRHWGRLGIWAAVAAVALTSAGMAAYTDAGAYRQNRIAAVRTDEGRSAVETEAEAQRLADAVRQLAADRDRLATRLNALERNLGDVTGSITPGTNRLGLATNPGQSTGPPMLAPTPPAPMVAAPGASPVPQVATPSPPAASIAVATKPTDPPASVADPGPTGSVATKTEFGIDLGGAPSVEGLRALWAQVKAGNETLLDGLRPVMNIRDAGKPGAFELRLVAGPLGNAGAAARLCAVLATAGLACQPTVFEGQRLALK
jgi:hypothetical protein